MGLRGPQPKSAGMRVLEGERAHRPLPAARPASAYGIPERPKRMTAAARRIWDQYVEQLGQLGTLRPVDVFSFARHCEDVALLEELQLGTRRLLTQMRVEAKAKGRKLNGGAAVSLMASHEGRRLTATINALASRIQRQELQFGLTPASAARVDGNVIPMPVGVQHGDGLGGIEAALCG